MAVLASAVATLLREGVGHGLTAWLRGDIPTELTSNHLSSMRPDRWVEAGGTLVNLFVGTVSLLGVRAIGRRAIGKPTRSVLNERQEIINSLVVWLCTQSTQELQHDPSISESSTPCFP
jgi:hypothetical protein